MKYYSGNNLLDFTWNQVARAFWQKYPNPQSKHVLTEDVLERWTEGNRLHTKRLICKTNSIPKWGERFAKGNKYLYLVEESVLDLATRTFVTYTRNIWLQKVMSVHEKITYTVSPETSTQTLCQKEAWVSSGIYGFRSLLSNFGYSRFKKNAAKATDGFNHVLTNLYSGCNNVAMDGVTSDPKKTRKEQLMDSAQRAKEMAKLKAEQATDMAKSSAEKASQIAKSGAERAKAKVISPVECSSSE